MAKKKPKKIKKTKKRIAVKKRKKVLVKRRKKAVKTVKKVLHKKIEKPAEKEIISPFSAESFFKAKIKVVGVGGGGGSIVSEIGRSLEKATFVIADTDARALKKRAGIKYFCFGQNLTHGLGTGVNVELARRAAEQDKDKISGIFKDQDILDLVKKYGVKQTEPSSPEYIITDPNQNVHFIEEKVSGKISWRKMHNNVNPIS